MADFEIRDLHVAVEGREILRGISLGLSCGEVHAVMGPNGSGKSTLAHIILGHPEYEVTGGRVTIDGFDILGLPTWRRALAGLYLAMQYPIEVPGVSVEHARAEAFRASGRDVATVPDLVTAEAVRIGYDARFLTRPMNVDLSGGEKKRNETLQLALFKPRLAILDETDSGLDVDALRTVAEGVRRVAGPEMGVLVITHYPRILEYLTPDVVHVFAEGRVVLSGDAELAHRIEREGYDPILGASSRTAGTPA